MANKKLSKELYGSTRNHNQIKTKIWQKNSQSQKTTTIYTACVNINIFKVLTGWLLATKFINSTFFNGNAQTFALYVYIYFWGCSLEIEREDPYLRTTSWFGNVCLQSESDCIDESNDRLFFFLLARSCACVNHVPLPIRLVWMARTLTHTSISVAIYPQFWISWRCTGFSPRNHGDYSPHSLERSMQAWHINTIRLHELRQWPIVYLDFTPG